MARQADYIGGVYPLLEFGFCEEPFGKSHLILNASRVSVLFQLWFQRLPVENDL